MTGGLGFAGGKIASSVASEAGKAGGLTGQIGKGVSKLVGGATWAHNLTSLGFTVAGLCHARVYDPNYGFGPNP